MLIAAVLIGTVQAFDQPSRSSIFPRLVEREHIVNAVAMESLVWNGVRVLAPALAGIMIEQISIQASMFFSAATFYVLGAVVALLRLRDRAPATGQVTQQVMEGIRYVRTHTVFFLIMLLTFCNSLFGYGLRTPDAVLCQRGFGSGSRQRWLPAGRLGHGSNNRHLDNCQVEGTITPRA